MLNQIGVRSITKRTAKKTAKKKAAPAKPPVTLKGRTDKKREHPDFTLGMITQENLPLFLKVFPEPHRRFVLEYVRSWNARAAYHKIHPDTTEKTAKGCGHKLLQDKKVQLYLDWLAHVANEEHDFNEKDWNKNVKLVFRKSIADKPIYDKDGNETGEYRFDSAGATKSLDLEAKKNGLYVKQIAILDGNIPHYIVHQLVVPMIRPINMADPKFTTNITEAVKNEIAERKKRR